MRFRFSALTKDGEPRSGFVEAEDEAAARRQLQRRGLTVESLNEEELAEAPAYAAGAATNPMGPLPEALGDALGVLTNKMPPLNPTALKQAFTRIDWQRLDWRRIGLAALLVALVLTVLGYGLSRALADRTYHLKVTGQFHLAGRGKGKGKTQGKVHPDYWKRVHPRLWLPKQQWFIDQTGRIYARGSDKKWKPIARKAKVHYTANIEGNYTIDIHVALPSMPEGAGVVFSARGYQRVVRKAKFKVKNNILECQVPTVNLKPLRSKTKARTRAKPKLTTPGQTPTPRKGKRKHKRRRRHRPQGTQTGTPP